MSEDSQRKSVIEEKSQVIYDINSYIYAFCMYVHVNVCMPLCVLCICECMYVCMYYFLIISPKG